MPAFYASGTLTQSGLSARPLLKAGLALLFLAAAVLANNFLELYLATRAAVEPRTTLGRTLSDRVDSFLRQLSPAARAALAQKLIATTSDRNVRLAIEDQATTGSYYQGTGARLEEQLRAAGFNGEHLQAEKDRVILKATLIYLKTLHPVLVRVIWKDFLKGFTETSNFSLATDPFAENAATGKYRLDDPDLWSPLNALSSTFLPESAAWLDRSAADVYLKGRSMKGFRRQHLGSILFWTLLSLGLCFVNRWGVFGPGDTGPDDLTNRDRHLCDHHGLRLFYDTVRLTVVGLRLDRAGSFHRRAVRGVRKEKPKA